MFAFLFALRIYRYRLSIAIKFDADDIWVAAHGAVFDVSLRTAAGGIDGDHNLFAAGIADVGDVVHGAVNRLRNTERQVDYFILTS